MELRDKGLPVSIREYLDLLKGLEKNIAGLSFNDFYFLSRAILVKDESHFDKFDIVFDKCFKGIENFDFNLIPEISEEWLKNLLFKDLTKEEKAKVKSLGGLKKLMEELKKRIDEQKKRHQGGSKWIGTGGTSPFGNSGYNPEGIRMGGQSRNRSAVKIWEKREFRDLDSNVTLGVRDIKIALRRLRKFARYGVPDELDLNHTIRATAHNGGYLDVKMRPERKNNVRVILFLDVGGSMSEHSSLCEKLFSAARAEFKSLDYFYFHNCIYESLWKDNSRRFSEKISTWDIIREHSPNTRVVFVGDASMSPYEITYPGGSIEHWNEEPGSTWLNRITDHFKNMVWINPEEKLQWNYTASNNIIREIIGDRMYPMTLEGLEAAMKNLAR